MKAVHKYKKVWWFWDGKDETKKRIGSYTSKVGAETGLEIWKEDEYQASQNLLFDENELTHIHDPESKCSCIDEIEQCSHCAEIKHGL